MRTSGVASGELAAAGACPPPQQAPFRSIDLGTNSSFQGARSIRIATFPAVNYVILLGYMSVIFRKAAWSRNRQKSRVPHQRAAVQRLCAESVGVPVDKPMLPPQRQRMVGEC